MPAPWLPYVVIAVLTAASAVYQHAQEVRAKRKQREAEQAAKEAAFQAISVKFDTESPHVIVYGRCRLGGTILFENTSGEKGKYLNILQTLAGHEVSEIESVWHDDVMAYDFKNGSSSLSYPGFSKHWAHRGTDTQTSSAEMTDRINDHQSYEVWGTHTHRGIGIAFIGSSFEFDIDGKAWPSGTPPTVTCIVRGKKVYDPRTGLTQWSDNSALCIMDALKTLGDEVDEDSFKVAADYCDGALASDAIIWTATSTFNPTQDVSEPANNKLYFHDSSWVCKNAYIGLGVTGSGIPAGTTITGIRSDYRKTEFTRYDPTDAYYGDVITTYYGENSLTLSQALPTPIGTGTVVKFYEPITKRFTCNGAYQLNQAPADYIGDMVTGCEGRLVKKRGKWFLYCGWTEPVGYIDETYLRDESQGITLLQSNIADCFNTAVGSFISKKDFWNSTDTTPIRSEKFLKEDQGVESQLRMDYKFTDTTLQAYRLLKHELFKSRYNRMLELKCNTKAKPYEHGDVVIVNLSQMGWTADNPHFFCIEERVVDNINGKVDFKLRETSPVIFDQSATQDDVQHPISFLNTNRGDVAVPSNVQAVIVNGKLHITWENAGNIRYSGVRLTVHYDNAEGKTLLTTVLDGNTTSYDCDVPDLNGIYYVEVRFISLAGVLGGINYTRFDNQTNTFDNKVQNTPTQATASLALQNAIALNSKFAGLSQTVAKNIKQAEDYAVALLNQATANSASMALLSSSFTITSTSQSNWIESIEEQVTANTSTLGSVQTGIFNINATLTSVSGGLLAETETRKTQVSAVSSSLREKADTSTVTTLANTVSTFSSSMASQLNAVTATSNNASANAALALNAITNANGSEANIVLRANANGVVTGISILSASGSGQTISTIDFQGNMQSHGFLPGSTGWQIKGDGTSELNNVTIRGKLLTSQVGSNSTIFHPSYPNVTVPMSSMLQGYAGGGSVTSTDQNYPDFFSILTLYGVGRRNANPGIPAYQCFARNNMNFIYSFSGWFDLYGTQHANLKPCYRINGGSWVELGFDYALGAGGNLEMATVTLPVQVNLSMTDTIEFGGRGYGPNYMGTLGMVMWTNI